MQRSAKRVFGTIDQARLVLTGGGIGGCSPAYYAGRMGGRDVVVVDRDRGSTTWATPRTRRG